MLDAMVPQPPGGGLLLEALAVATSTDAATIESFVATGLIRGPDAAGLYPRGDLTRIELIKALSRSGIGLEALVEAVAADRLSAARLTAAASPGEIWTTPAVVEAAPQAALVFEARASQLLEGLTESLPIRVAAVAQP